MDTETFLLDRNRIHMRLSERRMDALSARQASDSSGNWLTNALPFWLRMAAGVVLSKRGGFWTQALLTTAPMVLGLVKNVTGLGKSNGSHGGLLSFFPIVKSLIKRYN